MRFMLTIVSNNVCGMAVVAVLLLASNVLETPAATLEISGPPGASVRLGGTDLGVLPLDGPLELAPGMYRIECRAKGHHDLSEVIVLAEPQSWMHLRLRPTALERRHAVTASLFYAGLGQWYNGAKLRGWVYVAGESAGLFMALANELQRQNHRDDYLNYKSRYDQALLPGDIELWRDRAERAHRDLRDAASRRDTGLYVAAGAWILSLLDAWLLFPGVDIGPGLVPPVTDTSRPGTGLHAGLAFGF